MSSSRIAAALVVLGGVGLSACATKSDVQQLQADIAMFKAEAGRRDVARAAQLGEVIRMQQSILDSVLSTGRAMSRLKGDLTNDLYELKQLVVQVQELTGQSQQRLTELKTQLEAAREAQMQAVAPAPADAGSGAAAPVAQMFNASLDQLKRGNNSTARSGFAELVRVYPGSDQAANALYFIGESFTVENPDSAAYYYQLVVDNHAASLHAPSALFSLGKLAEDRKETAKAKTTYRLVVERYPKSPEADAAREKLKPKAPGR